MKCTDKKYSSRYSGGRLSFWENFRDEKIFCPGLMIFFMACSSAICNISFPCFKSKKDFVSFKRKKHGCFPFFFLFFFRRSITLSELAGDDTIYWGWYYCWGSCPCWWTHSRWGWFFLFFPCSTLSDLFGIWSMIGQGCSCISTPFSLYPLDI